MQLLPAIAAKISSEEKRRIFKKYIKTEKCMPSFLGNEIVHLENFVMKMSTISTTQLPAPSSLWMWFPPNFKQYSMFVVCVWYMHSCDCVSICVCPCVLGCLHMHKSEVDVRCLPHLLMDLEGITSARPVGYRSLRTLNLLSSAKAK